MAAGKLRERVTLQAETQTPDGAGGYSLGWSDVATVWASVKPMRGKESLESMQVRDVQPYEVMIRYNSAVTVTPKHRLSWNGKLLNIRSVVNRDMRDKYLMLHCEEGIGT